jgi:hypothetical protein
MLASEFEKRIKNIDSHLYVEVGDGLPALIKVRYSLINDNPLPVLMIGLSGDLTTCTNGFELLSNKSKRKLLIAGIDMSMTPLHKRVEHKWNVVIGEDNSKALPLIIWIKANHSYHDYFLGEAEKNDLKDSETRFSDSEYAKLIEYIKTLPDGEWQAKVAEHGKTEAKGDIK